MDEQIEQVSEQQVNESTVEEENTQIKGQNNFDYRKVREDRIVRNTEKRILKDLGESSFESVKDKLKNHVDVLKELEIQKDNGRKLNVYSAGFDDQFVDFVTHDVKIHQKEGEEFTEALAKYKKNHPQFLRQKQKIQFNTSPDLESRSFTDSYHSKMNDFFRGKINKI